MQLNLGQKIRELRQRDGRTQETLAEAIGVTSQAVSRWEANGGYPDMEMIPSIAHYFGVSIDELFGYNNERSQKINMLVEKIENMNFQNNGVDINIGECISFARNALIEFPGNEKIMLCLASALYNAGYVRYGEHHLTDEEGYDILDTAEPDTADAFFKKYILENTSTEFDSRWLENLLPRNEADKLLGRIGAAVTDYGVISARNGHLFEPVPYDEPEAKELKTQAMTDEKLDVIEILDRKALFSNGRLMPEQIPEGLYAYDLRHSDDGDRFCSIEPQVGVNHGGTVLMRDILDFGESGYIPLDEYTEPNFLGETMTASEFAEEEIQDESMQMGGM